MQMDEDEEQRLGEVPLYQASSDRKLSFWMLATIWTASILVASFLMTLFAPELVGLFHPVSDSLSTVEEIIVSFFAPPILTIWGIGFVIFTYKHRMLCAVPAICFIASYLISSMFSFPLSIFLSAATMIVMAYTLLQNRRKKLLNEKLLRARVK